MGARSASGGGPPPVPQAPQTTLMRLLLDTTVLIDALRNRNNRRALLAECVRSGHTLATTGINIAEVYSGMRPKEEAATSAFLDQLDCYDVTAEAGRLGGKFKSEWAGRGRTISIVDALIAAAAVVHSCSLLTDNQKDFPMPELRLYPLS